VPEPAAKRGWRHIFGPVPSRRFGRSLGIDPFDKKTCTFGCIFCEAGCTVVKTLDRREYAPVEEILNEFRAWLGTGEIADVVTLAGSGEPTLHARFGDILRGIRDACSLRRVLLSNGSLFYLPEVRREAAFADVVKVTLSAWDQRSFEALHRPHAGLNFDRVVEGLNAFRREYGGELCVEVFAAAGINDGVDAMKKIAELVNRLGPDRVYLNTLVRPGADRHVRGVDMAVLAEMAGFFRPQAELPAAFQGGAAGLKWDEQRILAMLERRPCSAADIAALAGISEAEATGRLALLEKRGLVRKEETGGCWVLK